mgnify:CR=1 FL=1
MEKYKTQYVNGVRKYIHRLVWEQHNGTISKGKVIHHINGNTHDNRINNLSCITQAENVRRPDCWGKGYQYKAGEKNPYLAIRKYNYKAIPKLGRYGTKCGAVMASRMAFITHLTHHNNTM